MSESHSSPAPEAWGGVGGKATRESAGRSSPADPVEKAIPQAIPQAMIEAHARTLAACAARAHRRSKGLPEPEDPEQSWRVFVLAAEDDIRRILAAAPADFLRGFLSLPASEEEEIERQRNEEMWEVYPDAPAPEPPSSLSSSSEEERRLPEDLTVDFGAPAPGSSQPMPEQVRRAYEERIEASASRGGVLHDRPPCGGPDLTEEERGTVEKALRAAEILASRILRSDGVVDSVWAGRCRLVDALHEARPALAKLRGSTAEHLPP